MSTLIHILTTVYISSALALTIFSSGIIILLIFWMRNRQRDVTLPHVADADLPAVAVQLPIYNEGEVVARLIRAVAQFDYPRDRLHIQVLDDSDDETVGLVAGVVAEIAATGVMIDHVRREGRAGYKAGAMAAALPAARGEYIAIFDADFIPEPDFLRRTIPHFISSPRVGTVQARWGHLNPTQNLITRSQAMSIDAHFVVEQTARSRSGLLISFNGTAGVWRRAAIEDAGGWSGDTIAEDLDLSYRAQMRGWKFVYLPDVEVRAEIPPQVAAYKRQQFRWAKGTTQNLIHLRSAVWNNPNLTLLQKFMGTLHLCQYLPQPLVLTMTILTPPLMLAGALKGLPLGPLGIVGVAAPLMYLVSQYVLYVNWTQRLVAFPLLIAIGTGVTFNNTIGIIEAFTRRPSVFKRTPKFSGTAWSQSRYALRPDWTLLVEIALTIYTFVGGVVALRLSPGIAPFLFAQTFGFGTIVVWSLNEWLHLGRGAGESA